MDEQQWLQGCGVWSMLQHLINCGRPPNDRKLRLFVSACCRRVVQALAAKRCRVAVEVAERYADQQASSRRLRDVRTQLSVTRTPEPDEPEFYFPLFRTAVGRLDHNRAADAACIAASYAGQEADAWRAEEGCQRRLLCCLFGNPFRPLSPRSFPPHVVGLAHAIYQAFPTVSEEYPILADALEELGATDAAAHCRDKLHARGCHVLDWIRAIE